MSISRVATLLVFRVATWSYRYDYSHFLENEREAIFD